MASVGMSTAVASRNGATVLKKAFMRSQKYNPMRP